MAKQDDQQALGTMPLVGGGVLLLVLAVVLAVSTAVPPAAVVVSLLLGGLLVSAGLVLRLSARTRGRAEAIRDLCATMGLVYTTAKELPDRAAAFAPFAHLKALRTGAKGVAWIARDPTGALPTTLVEHSYVVSTGKSTTRIRHCAGARPCPPAWPRLDITPRHLGHRLAGAFGRRGIQLEDPEFNRRWFVESEDDTFAALVLIPEMQTWLLGVPRPTAFVLGEGQLVCLRRKAPDASGVHALIDLLNGFEERLLPELAVYGA